MRVKEKRIEGEKDTKKMNLEERKKRIKRKIEISGK